jgi:hypothetical protein
MAKKKKPKDAVRLHRNALLREALALHQLTDPGHRARRIEVQCAALTSYIAKLTGKLRRQLRSPESTRPFRAAGTDDGLLKPRLPRAAPLAVDLSGGTAHRPAQKPLIVDREP